jgi:hypothetical protein
MNAGYAGLAAAYIFSALLLLGFYLRARRSWPVKAATAALAAAFFLGTWISIPGLLGWPVDRAPPRKFRLHAAHVQQPDKASKSKGAIYLWLTDAGDLAHNGIPRAYEFPYSAPLHETVMNATARLNKGMPQMGELRGPRRAASAVLDDPSRAGQGSVSFAFFDIPDPLFSDK